MIACTVSEKFCTYILRIRENFRNSQTNLPGLRMSWKTRLSRSGVIETNKMAAIIMSTRFAGQGQDQRDGCKVIAYQAVGKISWPSRISEKHCLSCLNWELERVKSYVIGKSGAVTTMNKHSFAKKII